MTKQLLLHRTINLGLYKLHDVFQRQQKYSVAAFLATLEGWHKRLGHPNYQTVHALFRKFHLPRSSNKLSSQRCEACKTSISIM